MRKLLTITALLLIAIALLGPGLTGRLTERAVIDNNDALAASLPDGLMLVEQQFDRGWFTSTSRYRLVLTDPARVAMFAQLLGVGEFADQPAITVNSVVAHGPLVGLFTPALGRVESLFIVDDDNGRQRALPFTLQSTIGLTGNSAFVGTLRAGGFENQSLSASWEDIRITQRADNTLSRVSIDIEAPSLSVMQGPAQNTTTFSEVELNTVLVREADRLRMSNEYDLTRRTGDVGEPSVTQGTFVVDDIPLAALPGLREPIRALSTAGPEGLPAAINASVPALLALLEGSLSLDWSQQTQSGAGAFEFELDVAMPSASTINTGNPQQALQQIIVASEGNLDVRMTATYAEQLAATSEQMYQQLTMMRGMGILAPDDTDEYLIADIVYEGGMLSVNGLPMPVSAPPLP